MTQFVLEKMYSYSEEKIVFYVAAFEKDGMASFFASSSIVLYYLIKRKLEKYIEIGLT